MDTDVTIYLLCYIVHIILFLKICLSLKSCVLKVNGRTLYVRCVCHVQL